MGSFAPLECYAARAERAQAIDRVSPGAAIADWTRRADELIDRRLKDAAAHAGCRDVSEAVDRVDELLVELVRLVGDARESFYRGAFIRHIRAGLDPAIHRTDLVPTREGERAARTIEVLGRSIGDDLGSLASPARAALRWAAGYGEYAALEGADRELWIATHSNAFSRLVSRELRDSATALRHAVGRLLTKGELRT
jgi:hypothetical protein